LGKARARRRLYEDEPLGPAAVAGTFRAIAWNSSAARPTRAAAAVGLADFCAMRNNRSVEPKPAETTLDTETLRPARTLSPGPEPTVPGLTILCHPDPARIGEQAHLHQLAHEGRAVLSRVEPEFRQPGTQPGRPLADPYLSRAPLQIERKGDALILSFDAGREDVRVDGAEAASPVVIPEAGLAAGVVVELAGRVALLLHALGMPRSPLQPGLGLVGASEPIEALRREIARAAPTDLPVLLCGESGTGKELVAAAIHAGSGRRDGPWISVNMAAVPASTAVSELFGHARGAFTGAASETLGYFGRADGGTLFLDEIADAPPDVQAMLLRVLETGEVQRVGADRPHRVDVRLVTATEESLEAAIASGRFRAALYHRIAASEIALPPLRRRRDDVARLLVHFLAEELGRLRQAHRLGPPADRRSPPLVPAPLVSRLVRHPWPGNVRQLRNLARQLALAAADGAPLGSSPAVERILGTGREEPPAPGRAPRRGAPPAEITEAELRQALAACGYRPARAAAMLGIGRTSIYRLMERVPGLRTVEDIPEEEIVCCHRECGGDLKAMSERLEVSERALRLRIRRLKDLGRP
jgi:DNA-binding NtrC family response regulator